MKRDGRQSHALFQVWRGMIRRCYEPNVTGYANYGGRGIRVCYRWRTSFWTFVKDIGPRPAGTTLDRIDNSGDYKPHNCRWATRSEQCRNTRFNRIISVRSTARTLEEWHQVTGMAKSTLFNRLRRGWTDEAAITKPVQLKRSGLLPVGIVARCQAKNVNYQTVKSRIYRGWTFEEALNGNRSSRS